MSLRMNLGEKIRHHWRTHKQDAVIVSIMMMMLSTLLFSVIAPVSALSTRVEPILLLCAGSFVALLVHIPFVKNLKQRLRTCPWKMYLLIAIGGAIGGWAYVLFTIALRISDNAIIPVLIFELYPVAAVFLAGIFLAKQKVMLSHYFWIAVCLFGVCVLMLDGQEMSYAGFQAAVAEDLHSILLMLFTVLIYAGGLIFVLKASRLMGGTAQDGIFTSLLIRAVHFLITLPFANWALMGDIAQKEDLISMGHIVVYGASALALSNILYYAAVNVNKSNMLHMMMYLGPIFSAAWLALLGLGSFTLATVLGGGLIILAVLKVTLPRKRITKKENTAKR